MFLVSKGRNLLENEFYKKPQIFLFINFSTVFFNPLSLSQARDIWKNYPKLKVRLLNDLFNQSAYENFRFYFIDSLRGSISKYFSRSPCKRNVRRLTAISEDKSAISAPKPKAGYPN